MSEKLRQLVLCPVQSDDLVSASQLHQTLAEVGLIGANVDSAHPYHFYIGPQFLQHVSFMGCAPAIEFAPKQDGVLSWSEFTFIYTPPTFEAPQYFADFDMAKPACPSCHKRLSLQHLTYKDMKSELTCTACSTTASLCKWDWREFGGCGRQFVFIANVYPKEGIPSDSLLNRLQQLTGFGWRYFYYYGELPNVTTTA